MPAPYTFPHPARLATVAVAAIAAIVGVLLAAHHPLAPSLAASAFVLWLVLAAWFPGLWLVVLPATLPWLNFSPWTGWIGLEEFDLLVLGAVAGGYLCHAWDGAKHQPIVVRVAPPSALLWLAVTLGGTAVIGLWRGLADAGLDFGRYEGYADALNSLRVFKPLAYALLLWPLLQRLLRVAAPRAVHLFASGLLCGLTVVTLAVLWERAAFPGLWDFSAPYRTVALFWEMHVGGAAIDAYLALTLPFVAWALWAAKSPAQWAGAAALAMVGCYAALTTFSRGVYLAVAAPLLLLGMLFLVRRLGLHARALLARAFLFAALAALSATALFIALDAFGVAGVVGVSAGLLGLLAMSRRRLGGWRGSAGLGLLLVLMLEVVAVFGTGTFMASRLNASDRDFGSRLEHWGNGLGLLHSPTDWLVGIGLGRLPAHYARFVPEREFSGAAQWVQMAQGQQVVRLSGPKTRLVLAGQFALTQRLPLRPEAAYRVEFDARVLEPIELSVSVCEMHLLYEGDCQTAQLRLRPGDTSWQHRVLALSGPALGAAALPRLRVFALSVLTAGSELELDNLRLTGSGPDNLLRNGDFARGLAHWLPAAQGYFVPWHIDNLYLELLIERGLAGLLLFLALAGLALRNLLAGPGRNQPIAPFLAASILGGLIVGLVSSVMDVPRVALLFWLLLFLALSLGRAGPLTSSAAGRTS